MLLHNRSKQEEKQIFYNEKKTYNEGMVALQAFCNTLKTSYHEFATPHYGVGGICKKGAALITVRKVLEKFNDYNQNMQCS